MSYRGPRAKLSRSLGVALTPKAAVVMQKRPHAPGQHGQRRRPAQSEFGKQLKEKQRLKFQYNVSERNLKRYYDIASSKKGNTPDNLVNLLEHRLDNFVRRSGIAPTIYAARQLVTHKHIMVNGKICNKPNYQVKATDVVQVKEKSRTLPIIVSSIANAVVPTYLELNRNECSARFLRRPETTEIPVECNMLLVVEYFAR